MKRVFCFLLVVLAIFMVASTVCAYANGDPNIDGGGGSMDGAEGDHVWNSGNEGVRVSVVRDSDKSVVGNIIDLTNVDPSSINIHFGGKTKLGYSKGQPLLPTTKEYDFINPQQALPAIIATGSGGNNTEAIKSYFTDEQVLRSIAKEVGISYDSLISGQYKVLLEPVAYVKYNGIMYAMTAHEAALYDEQIGGKLRPALGNLTHKNLPLAMFLEVSDLGFPAWSGTTASYVSNASIKSALGLGVVRFKDLPPAPPPVSYDYEYRVDTDVITSVWVSGGQSDPKSPTTVRFTILGRTYTVSNVYYPEDDSQLVWVKWRTPATPQDMQIQVSVSGPGSADKATVRCKIEDLSGNPPPNPVADDRNDGFSRSPVPTKAQQTAASWGVWRPWWKENWVWQADWKWVSDWEWEDGDCRPSCPEDCTSSHGSWEDNGSWQDFGKWVDKGWFEFDFDRYTASLSAEMEIKTDAKNPTAAGDTMKSGYGINQTVTAGVSSSQSNAVTAAQTAVSYFPEFGYEDYWRLLERTRSGNSAEFQFQKNEYSTYNRRTHFTPIWMPDGGYIVYTWLFDSWTPAGMLSMNLTDALAIRGSLWADWHIAPKSID